MVLYRGQSDSNDFYKITDLADIADVIEMGESFRAWIEVTEVIDEYSCH